MIMPVYINGIAVGFVIGASLMAIVHQMHKRMLLGMAKRREVECINGEFIVLVMESEFVEMETKLRK